MNPQHASPWIRWFKYISMQDVSLVGGKNASPGEMIQNLRPKGVSIPDGFAITAEAYRFFIDTNKLQNSIRQILSDLDSRDVDNLRERGAKVRGDQGLEIYVMCEIPSNVILAEEFAESFDGFSIGSNDLTQLILGVDRDSELVASIFDERNEAVKKMISTVIRVLKAKGRKIGICGQAPSDYPDFAQFLEREGIDSISLNPDAVLRTMKAMVEIEGEPSE